MAKKKTTKKVVKKTTAKKKTVKKKSVKKPKVTAKKAVVKKATKKTTKKKIVKAKLPQATVNKIVSESISDIEAEFAHDDLLDSDSENFGLDESSDEDDFDDEMREAKF